MSRECIICEELLLDGTPTTVVKQKGINSFVEASKKRGDGNVVLLKSCTELEVHEKCRKQYVNEKLIAAFIKRNKNITNASRELRSQDSKFSFKTHCFVCGVEVQPGYSAQQLKKPINKRNPVYPVRKLDSKENILKLVREKNDYRGPAIIGRIGAVLDLPAVNAQYHFTCMKSLYEPKLGRQTSCGRPRDDVEGAMQTIFTFLENSDEECQFTIDELMNQIEGDIRPHPRTIKARLIEKYGDDVLVTATIPYIVCFKATGQKILTNCWYEKRLPYAKERIRIVKTAAAIIVEDARSKVYDTTRYPPADIFLDGLEDLIPESLITFTDTVVMTKKKGNIEKWRKKSLALADCLLSAVRPMSYVSPLQVGVAGFLYRKFGSRRLLDVLSSLGFCSSYLEATRFEMSSIMQPPMTFNQPALSQLIYDNADFNVRTIDGYNTFHSMGGILCVTPKSAVVPGQHIDRLKVIPTAESIGRLGTVQVKLFERTNNIGLAGILIKELSASFAFASLVIPSALDLLWLYSKYKDLPDVRGLNGFLEEVTKKLPYEITCIDCQPFINSPPSDLNTIYTALMGSVEKTQSLVQVTTFVTFDQPLYLKARDVVASRQGDPALQNVVIRLGGFHLLMSFMGAVGFIMEGSGLAELFNTIYAANSTEKVMSGHAYARAVRAHLLAYRTLATLMFEAIEFSPYFHGEVEQVLYSADRSEIMTASDIDCVKELTKKFNDQLRHLTSLGPTAKLWSQYFQMVTLMMTFIDAERTGNWELHLKTIHEILPYFHSSGHYLYAKCSHLYLQDMIDLERTMPPQEFKLFTQDGFTIRRSDKFRCGTWTDMGIEQELMKHLKSAGGLTRGRGTSDAILSRWTLGMSTHRKICNAVEKFSGIDFASSEQHVDSRESNFNRDKKDAQTIMEWFCQHPPFPDTAELVSISTGVVGDDTINCHMSKEVGVECINAIVNKNFQSVKFKRTDRVKPLASMKRSIMVQAQSVIVNPNILFQRMCVAKQSDEQLEDFLTYELGPFPLALFDEAGLRKGTKSSLYKAFTSEPDITILELCTQYVVDGGFLLHRVVWSKGRTFGQICQSYIEYVQKKFLATAVVIFDGYSETEVGTKEFERIRRSRKQSAVEIHINETMVPTVSQGMFLSNSKNKQRLIDMLKSRLTDNQIKNKQATEDADTLICKTAQSLSSKHEVVIVVGEDIDLLVILIGTKTPGNVYFLKPGRSRVAPLVYHPQTTMETSLAEHILFIHAISGCDSTSALFQQGKVKSLKTVTQHSDLSPYIRRFSNPTATPEEITEAGKRFLVALYGGNHCTTNLNKVRFKSYITSIYKLTCNIASLPPTEAAAEQHSLRVFYQVQQWLGTKLSPEDWGWRKAANSLVPITTLKSPAPDALLKLVACSCKKGCSGNCGCRRVGLFCSKLCGSCEGNCSNTDRILVNDDDDDDDDVPLAEEAEQMRVEAEPSGGIQENNSRPAAKHPPEMQPSTTENPQAGPSGIKKRKTAM